MGALHVITGKGGTGKTTVALALAQALCARGPVLVCEVEGRAALAAALGIAEPRAGVEASVPGLPGLHLLSVDPRAALTEYLERNTPLGRAGRALDRFGLVDFATMIAPGLRDVLVLGKVYEAATRDVENARARGRTAYSAVVLDAPPTGRVGQFLGAPAALTTVALAGPIHAQAQRIDDFLRGAGTRIHLVATPAHMPVTETEAALREFEERGLPDGAVISNKVAPEPPAADVARDDPDTVALQGLLQDARARVAFQAPFLARLAHLERPNPRLPHVLADRPALAAELRDALEVRA